MDVKEFLMSGKRAEEMIQSDVEELERLRLMVTNLQSVNLNCRVRSSKKSEASFTALIDRIADMEDRINEEIDDYVDRKEEIRTEIGRLHNEDEKLCLKLKYMDGYSWQQIAEKMNFSERQIYRLHDRALKHFEMNFCGEKKVS